MFTSKRKLFSSERGPATSWLAGITSAALLIGTVALPAVATEDAPPPEELQSQEILSEAPMEDEELEESEPALNSAGSGSTEQSSFTMPPSEKGIAPKVIEGNPTCKSIRPDLIELKIDPPKTGEYTDGYLTIQFTRVDKEVRWSSNIGIDIVVVKGGDAGNAYVYDPPGPEQKSDTRLYSPIKNGQPADVSHVSFCYDKPIQLKKLKVEKTADGSYDREYVWDITKTVDGKEKSTKEIADGKSATFDYQVIAEQTEVKDSGWEVTGTITVTNPNNVAVPIEKLEDAIGTGWSCSLDSAAPKSIGAGASVPVDYTCTAAVKPSYSGTNTATVTFPTEFSTGGKDYEIPVGNASGDALFGLELDQVKNETVSVSDVLADPALFPATLTAKDAPKTYDYELSFEGEPGVCTKYPNTATIVGDDEKTLDSATATAKVCVGLDLEVSKDATGTYGRTYEWDLVKSVDETRIDVAGEGQAEFNYTVTAIPNGISDAGWKVTGKITVTNPNEWLDITADVSDAIDNGGVCLVKGEATYEVLVPKGESKELSYECTYDADSAPDTTDVTNTAKADWAQSYPTPNTSATVEKKFSFDSPSETNRKITVIDDKTSPDPVELGEVDYFNGIDGNPDTADFSFTYSVTQTGTPGQCVDYTNTAWIDELGKEFADSETVTVCAGADLSVEKTAAGSYSRTYTWDVTKVANEQSQNVPVGEKATFDYDVTVTQTGVSDSKVALGGTITITNPNEWPVTLDSISDDAGEGWVCTITTDGPYEVPAKTDNGDGTLPLAYTCSERGEDKGTNTVTIDWGQNDPYTYPTGTDTGIADFELVKYEVNKTVWVSDLLVNTEAFPDGVLDDALMALDTKPYTTATYGYSLEWEARAGECVDYDNTAVVSSVDEEGQPDVQLDSATETVEVCGLSSITVTKTDADNGLPLAGAKFQLWTDADKSKDLTAGDSPIEGSERITGSDGLAVWDDLLAGYYLVEEVTPPTGYGPASPNPRSVVIGGESSGEVELEAAVAQVKEASVGGPSEWRPFDPKFNQVAYWCPDGGTKVEPGGSSYTLTGAYPTVVVKSGAGDFAHTVFTNTTSGQVVWADTNGDGIFNPGGKDGDKEISHVILCDGPGDPEPGDIELIFANPRLPGQITVVKTDDAAAPMANVTFALFRDANKDGIIDEGESIGQKSTMLPGGTATWTGLEWGSDYKVAEISSPNGYQPAGPIVQGPFTIGATSLSASVTFVNNRIDIPKLDKTSDPAEPTAVEAGNTITYTILVKNEGALPLTNQTLEDVLPTGVTLDTDTVTPDATTISEGTITWKFDLGAFSEKEFTYTVNVTAGFGSPNLVNTATWVERELTDKTEHPVKAIAADTTSFCVIDAPYYSLSVKSQNLVDPNGTVTVNWYQANELGQPIDAQGNPTTDPAAFVPSYDPAIGPGAGDYVDTYSLTDGVLDLPEMLWKGAAVDADGSAIAWPGWEQPSPGVWVQVDSGGVRPGMFAVITVNPTAQTAAIYPPAAAPCANPPGVPQLDKTADPAEGTEVAIDDTIDYSVEVTNTGGSEFTGPMVDTLPIGFAADEESISDDGVLSADGTTITWQVTLAAGEAKTFTYSGTVGPDAADELLNVVVLTLEDGSTIQDQTVHPVAPVEGIEEEEEDPVDGEELADTGANGVGNLVGAALVAMLAGGLMVTFGRRRREE